MTVYNILLTRFDTHGDHVLLSGFLTALIDKFPQANITLLVRKGYEQLSLLLPVKIRWLTTTVMPYGQFRSTDELELLRVLATVSEDKYDLFLVTTYNRTWLDEVVAAKLAGTSRIAIGEPREIPEEVITIAQAEGLNLGNPYDMVVDVDQWSHETLKYQLLWDTLYPEDQKKLSEPRLEVPDILHEEAIKELATLGLLPDKFFVCAPAGIQNVSIKSWPQERFAEVIYCVERKYGLKPLIVGHESEMLILKDVATLVHDHGGAATVWGGKDNNFALVSAIIQSAKFYFGNDSGLMHVAAALGIPVVGVFGGGTYPRFVPTGLKSFSVVAELPCFGCYWNCIFENAPCMRFVDVKSVVNTIDYVFSDTMSTNRAVNIKAKLPTGVHEIISRAKDNMMKMNKLSLQLDVLTVTIESYTARISAIESSISWRITKPLRTLGDWVRRCLK